MPKTFPDRQITVGDRSYTVRFSIKAMAALQDHYSLASIDEVGAHLAQMKFGLGDITAILWAGLRSRHPEVTLDQAEDIVDEAGLDGLQDLLGSAFGTALPPSKPGAGKSGPTQRGR